MARSEIKIQLEQLLELLLEERKMALELNMEGLQQIVQAKAELLAALKPQPEDVDGLEDLLKRVDEENRRNAFLLWTGLNWVRDMMGFFGKSTTPQVYGGYGQARSLNQGGQLLSGKV